MKVILFQPQIPQNTGNIVRTCNATKSSLILVKPLGFSTSSRHLKRAGLDYWEGVEVEEIEDLEEYLKKSNSPFYFLSSKVARPYTDISFTQNAILIFGSETSGLPPQFKSLWKDKFFTIPMQKDARCLNLSNSVAIVLYEGLRQQDFKQLR